MAGCRAAGQDLVRLGVGGPSTLAVLGRCWLGRPGWAGRRAATAGRSGRRERPQLERQDHGGAGGWPPCSPRRRCCTPTTSPGTTASSPGASCWCDDVLPDVRAGTAGCVPAAGLGGAAGVTGSDRVARRPGVPGHRGGRREPAVGAPTCSMRCIWVETDEPTRLGPRRGPDRGRRDAVGDYAAWMAEENAYVTASRPWEQATFVVNGSGLPATTPRPRSSSPPPESRPAPAPAVGFPRERVTPALCSRHVLGEATVSRAERALHCPQQKLERRTRPSSACAQPSRRAPADRTLVRVNLAGEIIRLNGGFFTRAEALGCGESDRSLRAAVHRGDVLRLRPRHRTPPAAQHRALDGAARHLVNARAAVAAQRDAVALTGPSAAVLHGYAIWGHDADVHVLRLGRSAARRQAGVVHHVQTTADASVQSYGGVLAVGPARAAWETARLSSLEGGVVTLDSCAAPRPRPDRAAPRAGQAARLPSGLPHGAHGAPPRARQERVSR